ncbi:hypothetical protein ALC53_01421 [Atta colombica]|uniref:Uncharacterized protein n=1 Tax=Atta colombica TaxID=520822 RepID=A0A195BTT9_9HYME|nr:hypothetical protein ALC53_01421 [Atta colombica]
MCSTRWESLDTVVFLRWRAAIDDNSHCETAVLPRYVELTYKSRSENKSREGGITWISITLTINWILARYRRGEERRDEREREWDQRRTTKISRELRVEAP